MGEQGLDSWHFSLTNTTFVQNNTYADIPWSSQNMQVVLLACLAAALVIVPAANAQVSLCQNPERKGDLVCDDGNNNANCGWDGGDCCLTNSEKCHDPAMKPSRVRRDLEIAETVPQIPDKRDNKPNGVEDTM